MDSMNLYWEELINYLYYLPCKTAFEHHTKLSIIDKFV